MARSPEEQKQFEQEEALRANQVQYDPAKHGAGTVEPVAPGSVSELHKVVQGLESRIKRLESMLMGSAKPQRVSPPPPPVAPDPPEDDMPTGTGSNTETGQVGHSPFSKH